MKHIKEAETFVKLENARHETRTTNLMLNTVRSVLNTPRVSTTLVYSDVATQGSTNEEVMMSESIFEDILPLAKYVKKKGKKFF